MLAKLGITGSRYGYLDNERMGIESTNIEAYRADPRLIEAIEAIGLEGSAGSCAKLKIVEIPEGIDFTIEDYGGIESIREAHRVWS